MSVQLSVTCRNAKLDAIETAIGASAIMKIFDGSIPANCAAADAGTVLATISLGSDWMSAASSGSKSKSGTWQDASADNNGTADYYRIYASDGTTCHVQGTVATSGGDMTVDSVTFTAGQPFTITSYSWTEGNS